MFFFFFFFFVFLPSEQTSEQNQLSAKEARLIYYQNSKITICLVHILILVDKITYINVVILIDFKNSALDA